MLMRGAGGVLGGLPEISAVISKQSARRYCTPNADVIIPVYPFSVAAGYSLGGMVCILHHKFVACRTAVKASNFPRVREPAIPTI